MELDFNYTCGEIDDAITDVKSLAETVLTDFLYDLSNCDNEEDTQRLLRDSLGYFNDEFIHYFEKVRQLNSDMRDAADKQLTSLDNELYDCQQETLDLQNLIDDKESYIKTLEDEIYELKNTLTC